MANLLLDEIENFTNYESVLNSISDLICILDREHNVIFENHASIAMYGKNTGEKCYKVYVKREGVCDNCPTAKVFSNNGATISEQKPYDAQGVEQCVEIVASPLFNKNGETERRGLRWQLVVKFKNCCFYSCITQDSFRQGLIHGNSESHLVRTATGNFKKGEKRGHHRFAVTVAPSLGYVKYCIRFR